MGNMNFSCYFYSAFMCALLIHSKTKKKHGKCVVYNQDELLFKLRLGAQSVTVLSTLRDPTQLRKRQCATRQQHPISHIFLGSLPPPM